MINVYIREKILLAWFTEISKDLENIYSFNTHNSPISLEKELNNLSADNSIVLIDIEPADNKIFTKKYFDQQNIKFIGIGFKKNADEIIDLLRSNIYSFICFDCTSIDVIKAIKNSEKNKIFICEETKDQVLKKYFETNNKKTLKVSTKINETVSYQIANSIETKPLTEKEKKISGLLVQGLSYKEIAQVMGVSTFAINQNIKIIYKKLKVNSRSALSYKLLY